MRNFRLWSVSSVAVALAVICSGVVALSPHPAAATGVTGERASAAILYRQIQSIYGRINGLAQQYDSTQLELSQIKHNISSTQNAVTGIGRDLAKGTTQLRTDVVFAYVTNGSAVGSDTLFTSSPTKSGATNVYSQLATGNIGTTLERLKGYRMQLTHEHTVLAREDRRAASQVATAVAAIRSAQHLQKTLQHSLRRVKGRIASYFREQQAAAAAAAFKALQASRALRAAQVVQAERAMQAARALQASRALQARAVRARDLKSRGTAPSTTARTTRTTTPVSVPSPVVAPPPASVPSPVTTPAPVSVPTPTPPSSVPAPPSDPRASIAVRAAMGLIGVPYVWGGASPSGVDCSGLVMLAYEAAGIYLPHYSGAQFLDTTRVPLYDMQPGDILFYGYQGDTHEAIYIGGGKMVQAEQTGTLVQITPVWLGTSSFPLAGVGRPRT